MCRQNPCLSYVQFFAETLQTNILSLDSLVLKHKSLLLDDESVPGSLSRHAHTQSWLIL